MTLTGRIATHAIASAINGRVGEFNTSDKKVSLPCSRLLRHLRSPIGINAAGQVVQCYQAQRYG